MPDDNPTTTTCPYCGVHFLTGPTVCPHCGRQLTTTTGGIPLIKSPLGGRAWSYEYGQTEMTEMLSYCLMQNIDALADSGFVFSTDNSGLAFPQPMEVFLNQVQENETVPLPVQQHYPEFPAGVWAQQTAAIQQQSAMLERIKATLQEKYDKLPAETKQPGFFQNLIQGLLSDFAEKIFWGAVKFLFRGMFIQSIVWGTVVIGIWKFKQLVDKIFDSIGDCTTMTTENTEIQNLEMGEPDAQQAWPYFQLRETILQRHQRDIHNMLTELMTLEKDAKNAVVEDNENLSELVDAIKDLNLGDLSQLTQAVKDLQYNGQTYWFKDGSKLELHGQTPSESE